MKSTDGIDISRVVFTIHHPRSPLIPLEAPDVRSSDESEANISSDDLGSASETENQRQARQKKNKLRQGRRRRAHQRKEAWIKYEIDLIEYNRKKFEREAEDKRATGKPRNDTYGKIRELAQELDDISHPNEEQECLREILRTATRKPQGGQGHTKQPDKATSHRQNSQNQRKSAFKRLGPSVSSNKGSRGNQRQSNQVEQSRDYRNGPPLLSIPRSDSRDIN